MELEMNLGVLNYPDFLTVDGLLSLRKSTSFNCLQTLQKGVAPKNSNNFQDIREVSDGSSCVTETESDDGSLPSNSAKRTKFDSSSESLLSMSLDLSNTSIELPSLQTVGATLVQSESSSDFSHRSVNMGGLTPGASFSRGKYKCRHCGVFKTSHVCPVIADSVLMCSKTTAIDPVMVMVIDSTLVIAEKTIGVRKWQGN